MLRRATPEDADTIADVLTSARAAQAWMPKLHTAEDNRKFIRELLLPTHDVWVAEEDGSVVGFAAVKDDELGHIFVHPSVQGRGIGKTLLEKTKELRPDGFILWTHQLNEQACRVYEREGFVAVEFTDGATNEEKLPDVRYAWSPGSPGSAVR